MGDRIIGLHMFLSWPLKKDEETLQRVTGSTTNTSEQHNCGGGCSLRHEILEQGERIHFHWGQISLKDAFKGLNVISTP